MIKRANAMPPSIVHRYVIDLMTHFSGVRNLTKTGAALVYEYLQTEL